MKKFRLKIQQDVKLEHEITVFAESEQMLDSMINIVESLPLYERGFVDDYAEQLKKVGIKIESYVEEDIDRGIVYDFTCTDLTEIIETEIIEAE